MWSRPGFAWFCAVVPQQGSEVREQGRGRDSAPVFILKLMHSMSIYWWSESLLPNQLFSFFLVFLKDYVKENEKRFRVDFKCMVTLHNSRLYKSLCTNEVFVCAHTQT